MLEAHTESKPASSARAARPASRRPPSGVAGLASRLLNWRPSPTCHGPRCTANLRLRTLTYFFDPAVGVSGWRRWRGGGGFVGARPQSASAAPVCSPEPGVLTAGGGTAESGAGAGWTTLPPAERAPVPELGGGPAPRRARSTGEARAGALQGPRTTRRARVRKTAARRFMAGQVERSPWSTGPPPSTSSARPVSRRSSRTSARRWGRPTRSHRRRSQTS